ncbi:hypothetical protein K1W69_18400 [Hoeflea sp. WL0058]|uniref:Restriction endonuclease type IV Mrr domain-containing protein n=1 Tax=Flavimaribacter sediminis TaxID=2865987 RepID=A0AAE3D324_9HYPH|nr:hypothetical protein [Flavimaribacter sediminis]MBW8639173.1 hypothetical protein [Flavimaribacter sediminis]
MRVSQFYDLGRNQGTLDFVDVELNTDVPVFVSPRALHELGSDFGQHCEFLVQNFFQHVISLIRDGNHKQAEELLATLREPNETHLGLSKDAPAGRAMGDGSAHKVWQALSTSEAAKSGLLKDLEDTALLVRGINRDVISDITTNIIRAPLIQYTQHVCDYYGIHKESGVSSGNIWHPDEHKWVQDFVDLPVPNGFGRILLVPKAIVRLSLGYDASEYYRHYLLERMREAEEAAHTGLVALIQGGPRRGQVGVTKKALIEKYGQNKDSIVSQTLRFPDVLDAYKRTKDSAPSLPLSHYQFPDGDGSSTPDWNTLLSNIQTIPTGRKDAAKYEDAIESLLTALFYPALTNPTKQTRIHAGQKIIDITYTNMGVAGFFSWVRGHYSSAMLMVECKNYGNEVANPEVDQLSGRFSPSRGTVGLLVCRNVLDLESLLERCRNTAADARGYIIPLTDADLAELVNARTTAMDSLEFPLLRRRFEQLIL